MHCLLRYFRKLNKIKYNNNREDKMNCDYKKLNEITENVKSTTINNDSKKSKCSFVIRKKFKLKKNKKNYFPITTNDDDDDKVTDNDYVKIINNNKHNHYKNTTIINSSSLKTTNSTSTNDNNRKSSDRKKNINQHHQQQDNSYYYQNDDKNKREKQHQQLYNEKNHQQQQQSKKIVERKNKYNVYKFMKRLLLQRKLKKPLQKRYIEIFNYNYFKSTSNINNNNNNNNNNNHYYSNLEELTTSTSSYSIEAEENNSSNKFNDMQDVRIRVERPNNNINNNHNNNNNNNNINNNHIHNNNNNNNNNNSNINNNHIHNNTINNNNQNNNNNNNHHHNTINNNINNNLHHLHTQNLHHLQNNGSPNHQRPIHLFQKQNLNNNNEHNLLKHQSHSPSSEEDNSPTEMNNCRRILDKPPLVKRLTMGLLRTTEESRPLVHNNNHNNHNNKSSPSTGSIHTICDGYVNEGICDPEKLISSKFGDSCRKSLTVLDNNKEITTDNIEFDFKKNFIRETSSANSSPKIFAPTAPLRFDGLSTMEQNELKGAGWFQAGIPREISLDILSRENPGAFLVRQSSTKPGCFALSLRVPPPAPKVAHYLILKTIRGYKIKGFTKEFTSLRALITHHSVMPELLPVPLALPRPQNIIPQRRNLDDFDTYGSLNDFRKMMSDLNS